MPYPPGPRRRGERRRPDFLCIGAQKAGTSWLAANLSAHPQVWSPYRKELHHFDARLGIKRKLREKRTAQHIAAALRRAKRARAARPVLLHLHRLMARPQRYFTDEWYQEVFAPAPFDMSAGEYTPRYSALPEEGLADIRRTCPDARIIWILRDPAERDLSAFRMYLHRRGVLRGHTSAVERAARAWLEGEAFDRGAYADQIPRWERFRILGDDLLYLPFGRLKRDPRGFLEEVEKFLGLDSFEDWPKLGGGVNRTRHAELPAWFVDAVCERAEPHRAFVERHLGRDFAAEMA